MNRIHQKYRIYRPTMSEASVIMPYDIQVNSPTYSHEKAIEIMGSYRKQKHDIRKMVFIASKTVSVEDKIVNFNSSFDVPIDNKIEIDGEEYTIINKTYQLNGDVDYVVEDKFIKCENYDELYNEIREETKNYLLMKRELEDKLDEKVVDEKKSIWWYFSIR